MAHLSLNTPQGAWEKTLTSPPSGPLPPELGSLRPAATLIFQAKISRAEKQSPCWQMDGIAPQLWGRQFSGSPEDVWTDGEGQECWTCRGDRDVSSRPSLERSDGSVSDQVKRSSSLSRPLTLPCVAHSIYSNLGLGLS